MSRCRDLFRVRPAVPTLTGALMLGAATVAFTAPSSADVTQLDGSAFGYLANVSLFGGPSTTRPCDDPPANTKDCRARPAVTLPAEGSAVPITDTAATGDARFGPGIVFTSGPISVSTVGTTGPTGSVTSTAGIQTINTSGQEVLTAATVASTCTANEAGVAGSTTVTGGTLRTSQGANPDSEADDTVVAIPANPPPNTMISGAIESVGDTFTFIFNEQIVDPATGMLTVNAGHEVLEGPTAKGDLTFGQVVCGATAATDATTTSTVPGSTTSTTAGSTTSTVAGSTTTSTTVGSTTSTTAPAGTTTTQATRVLAVQQGGSGTGRTGTLPRTGSDAAMLAMIGLGLVAGGAVLRRSGRPKAG